jgi:hypothetical protein
MALPQTIKDRKAVLTVKEVNKTLTDAEKVELKVVRDAELKALKDKAVNDLKDKGIS